MRDLADLAELRWGGAAVYWAVMGEPEFRRALAADFNSLTPENCLKMQTLRPAPHRFDFTEADRLVAFAADHGMRVRGHTLVWHRQLPEWLTAEAMTGEEARLFLKRHIYTVVGRYRDTIDEWDVVNEAVEKDGSLRKTVWLETIGPEYIELAFRWAHEADPAAKLFYNDYGIAKGGPKADAVFELLETLTAKGVPVHGIGFQSHFRTNLDLPWDRLPENFERFRRLGLERAVTELDIRIPEPVTEAKLRRQAEMGARFLRVCLGAGIRNFTVWGVTDAASWIPHTFADYDAGLLRDRDYLKKPVYRAVEEVLQESPENAKP